MAGEQVRFVPNVGANWSLSVNVVLLKNRPGLYMAKLSFS